MDNPGTWPGIDLHLLAQNFRLCARFVNDLEIKSAGTLLLKMEGGISISENPNLRFSYGATGSGDAIEVTARDTEGATFADRSAGGS